MNVFTPQPATVTDHEIANEMGAVPFEGGRVRFDRFEGTIPDRGTTTITVFVGDNVGHADARRVACDLDCRCAVEISRLVWTSHRTTELIANQRVVKDGYGATTRYEIDLTDSDYTLLMKALAVGQNWSTEADALGMEHVRTILAQASSRSTSCSIGVHLLDPLTGFCSNCGVKLPTINELGGTE